MFWGFKRVFRGPAPAAEREATRAEAYLDFLEAQNLALRVELAEAKQAAATAGLIAYYYMGSRRPVDDRTVVLAASRLQRWKGRTEVFRR